jgi:hypothetical protein
MRYLVSLTVAPLLLAAFLLVSCGSDSKGTPNIGWTQLSGPGPSPRWTHAAVFDPARKNALVFGGAGPAVGTEVWIFSFDNRSWTMVNPPNAPSLRASPSAVTDPTGDRMVVVGGLAPNATDEVWAFSLANQTWSPLPKGPSPRFDMGATTDGTYAWFYGGFLDGFIPVDELWQFEFATNTWTSLPQSQVRPSPRTNMALAFHAGSLYVVGGHDRTGLTPGTWRYDLASNTWTELNPGTPDAGAHYASAIDEACGTLVLAGGDHDDNIDLNVTDVFSFSQPSFTKLPVQTNFLPGRRHSVLVLEPASQTFMLFGGLNDPSDILGDTWLYQMKSCVQ